MKLTKQMLYRLIENKVDLAQQELEEKIKIDEQLYADAADHLRKMYDLREKLKDAIPSIKQIPIGHKYYTQLIKNWKEFTKDDEVDQAYEDAMTFADKALEFADNYDFDKYNEFYRKDKALGKNSVFKRAQIAGEKFFLNGIKYIISQKDVGYVPETVSPEEYLKAADDLVKHAQMMLKHRRDMLKHTKYMRDIANNRYNKTI
jgi:tetratricopeptide (TPR) repeat protein